jgi:S1-C subfamily serine protease
MRPSFRTRALFCAAWVMGLGAASCPADTVILKDGTHLEGIVVIEMPNKVVLKQAGGNKVISRDDIDTITKTARAEPIPSAPAPRAAQAAAARPGVPASSGEPAANAVVKVYATMSRPDPTKPWARLPPRDEVGSGIVVEGKQILTSAHLLFYASQIQIKANQADDRISAHVVAIAPLLDLALLKIDDESFFESHPTLPRSNAIPRTRDVVSTFGYPGDSTNVTVIRASVTEVDFAGYSYPISGVRIRTNNDFGVGMSGSPVMMNDRLVGIACRHPNSQVSSFVMPNDEIDPFLEGSRTGGYKGKPVIFDEIQKLENPALREFLKLDRSVHGVVVTKTAGVDGNYPLRPWDVITAIADTPIDDLGTIPFGENGRVPFGYVTQRAALSGSVAVTIMRNGREMVLSVPTPTSRPLLVPSNEGVYPSYFIFGPIAFAAATTDIYSLTARSEQLDGLLTYRGSPLITRRAERPAFDGEEIVYVPSPFFPHKLAKGYSDPTLCTLKAVNGIPVRNLLQVVKQLRDTTDEFVTFEFAEKDAEILVFPWAAMVEATEGILSDNGVRSQGSADTMAVWNEKPAK